MNEDTRIRVVGYGNKLFEANDLPCEKVVCHNGKYYPNNHPDVVSTASGSFVHKQDPNLLNFGTRWVEVNKKVFREVDNKLVEVDKNTLKSLLKDDQYLLFDLSAFGHELIAVEHFRRCVKGVFIHPTYKIPCTTVVPVWIKKLDGIDKVTPRSSIGLDKIADVNQDYVFGSQVTIGRAMTQALAYICTKDWVFAKHQDFKGRVVIGFTKADNAVRLTYGNEVFFVDKSLYEKHKHYYSMDPYGNLLRQEFTISRWFQLDNSNRQKRVLSTQLHVGLNFKKDADITEALNTDISDFLTHACNSKPDVGKKPKVYKFDNKHIEVCAAWVCKSANAYNSVTFFYKSECISVIIDRPLEVAYKLHMSISDDNMQSILAEIARRNCSSRNPFSNKPTNRVATNSNMVGMYQMDYEDVVTSLVHNTAKKEGTVYSLLGSFPFTHLMKYPRDEYEVPRGGNYVRVASAAPRISPTTKKTAGLGYTFGLEIETAMGDVDLSALNVSVAGDGSITGNEYVTSPMHGDYGIEKLKWITSAMTSQMLVDDTCSVHVHIGGAPGADSPKFTRMFSGAALRLGQMLESELMSMIPYCRKKMENSQGIRFLGKIQDVFGDEKITVHNAKESVARYVFGVKRWDRSNNSNANIGRWNASRYRWLNLLNCNSRNESEYRAGRDARGFQTIEFRLWPPATDMHHIYTYVMISMAFVWYVENRLSKIWKSESLTLKDVISAATRRHSGVRNFLLDMIQDMKDRYSPNGVSKATELKLPI